LASRNRAGICALLLLACAVAHGGDAAQNYLRFCQGCHTATGAGLEGKVPDLRPVLVPMAKLAEGRKYLVRVPGVAQSTLGDAEAAAVLNWMLRNLADQKNIAGLQAFTAQEVEAYRRTRMLEVRKTRETLLARIAADGG